ncbi:MAG: YncE family protein, partial [Terriglobales bacterium]
IFSPDGTNAFMGTDLGELGTRGLMQYTASATAPAVTQNTGVVGKILSISPDSNKLVVSDIADSNSTPQAFIFDTATHSTTSIQLSSGTTSVAADFSPDSLKAFIVASSGGASTLYIYSKVDALQTIPLTAGTSDVAFLPSGNFGYVAARAIPQLSLVPTCDNPPPSTPPLVETSATTAPPLIIRPLVDGKMLTVEQAGIELFTPMISGTGCAFPRPYPGALDLIAGNLTVSNTSAFFNLGEGNFIPRQLIVSGDSSTAYILANDANNNPLGVILVFNILNHTSSAVSLTGNAIPLRAALTPDGTALYVGASDGTVHALSTVAGGDFQQIAFPLGLCRNATGAPFATTCNPDLLAIRP